jgi:serine/threonine-protein kinase
MAMLKFKMECRLKWLTALQSLGSAPPTQAVWTGVHNIAAVVQPFAASGCNHVLLPSGGGMDVISVVPSSEHDCIELVLSKRSAYVMKPERLILRHFPDAPLESFLLLELQNLAPSGIYSQLTRGSEELVELDSENYIERSYWDEGTYGSDSSGNPRPLPAHARLIVRWFGGKAMMLSKGSIWNGVPATYDGRHSRMTADEISKQINDVLVGLGSSYLT